MGFIGTYTGKGSEGIYSFNFDSNAGEVNLTGNYAKTTNPSYIAVHPHKQCIYAVNEIDHIGNEKTGLVSAFKFDNNGAFTYLNSKKTQGPEPAYLAVDKTGNFLAVANYRNGSVSIFPLSQDGNLEDISSLTQHQGKSINPSRQEGPHAHSTVFNHLNKRLYVPDLGIDKIMIYQLNNGKIEKNNPDSCPIENGSGPRHMTFHPKNNYAYVINELSSTIIALKVEKNGGLTPTQTVKTLPPNYEGENTASDIHLTPSGNFLLGSNRGHNSIVTFKVEEKTGMLTYLDHVSSRGKMPRTFRIDPTGTYVLATNMDSNTITTFALNEKGNLKFTGKRIEVANPTCITFFRLT